MSMTVFCGALGLCMIPFVIVTPERGQLDSAVLKIDQQLPFENKEVFVVIVVLMPVIFP